MKSYNSEVIGVSENFVPVDTKVLDAKNRINLGGKIKGALSKKMKVDGFRVFIGEDGDILLRPIATVPSNEAWLYKNASAFKQVHQGVRDARHGAVKKVVDLDEFLNDL